ncbi:hypothetical protein P9139_09875 [Curtobacterium flaccumfaciens]|nr:hypothetical protein P9139_09875 [Curtobacterium flaccumfaciens]
MLVSARRTAIQMRNGSASRYVSLESTAIPRHAAAPANPASCWRRLITRTNAARSHGVATLSMYTVRWYCSASGESANTRPATAAVSRVVPSRRASANSRTLETAARKTIASRPASTANGYRANAPVSEV